MRFFGRLSDEEIGDYLREASPHRLAILGGIVVMPPEHLTEKGVQSQASARKLLKKHQALFRDCRSGSDIDARVHSIVDKWPDLSSAEKSLLSDLVKAHRAGWSA